MIDLATHALAFVAGAVPAVIWARIQVNSAQDSIEHALSNLAVWQRAYEAAMARCEELTAKYTSLTDRAPNGRFVKKEGK